MALLGASSSCQHPKHAARRRQIVLTDDGMFVRAEDANAPAVGKAPLMPRTLLIAALIVLALALPASALADPGLIDHVSQGPAGGNAAVHVDQGRLSNDGRCTE